MRKKTCALLACAALLANGMTTALADTKPTVKNGDFVNGEGWSISNSANMNISDGKLNASGSGYEARLSQTVEGVENGVYNLNAYAVNDTTDGVCYLYAKTKGHTMASTSVPVCASAMKITVPNIIVEDGSCDIGLYINGSNTLTLDDISLSPSESSRVPFLKGGEISKLTYLEEQGGIKYKDSDGTERDCLQIMAENGFNLARIRLLNNPGKGRGDGNYYLPEGYMDFEDCVNMARRAKDKGMQLEWTFAYSDYWVDGGTQMPPVDWLDGASGKSGAALGAYYADKIYSYTREVLSELKTLGIEPEYISIGNEMQYGMCFGKYNANNGLYDNSTYIAQLSNAGARAVREICPNSKIILHSDNGGKLSKRTRFMAALQNIDFDVLGVSFYPYYNNDVSISGVVDEFNSMITKYDKDVIIMETGYNWNELRADGWEGQLQDSGYYQDIYGETKEGQKAFLTELYARLRQVLGGRCIGDLYWDPVMAYDNSSWTDGKGYNTGWAIRESDDCTDINVVSNSCLFDFDDKALPAFDAMKYNTNATDKVLISGKIKNGRKAVADTEVKITANYNEYTVKTDAYGEYIVAIDYPDDEKIGITAEGYNGSYYIDAPQYGAFLGGIDFPAERNDEIPAYETEKITGLSVSRTETGVNYKARYNTENENAVLYIALYDDRGALAACRKNSETGFFALSSAEDKKYTVKALLWDGMRAIDMEAQSPEDNS